METPDGYGNQPGGNPERWIPAIILIGIGTLFFLNNLHILYIHDLFRYWPVALIAGGIFKVVDSTCTTSRVAGGILISVGGVLLAINLGYLAMSWGELWPLALIAAGVYMIANRVSGDCGVFPAGRHTHSRTRFGGSLHEAAVFGGGKRVITDPNFSGGKIDAVFGGFEIDLRGASMAGDAAVLDINAVFGGVEVKIPTTWNAVVRGTGVFGGYVDSTRHPHPADVPNPKQLVLRGGAVFGGVEIKN